MKKSRKWFNNILLPLFTLAGGLVIFRSGRGVSVEHLFYPAALVALYGFLISSSLRNCHDSSHYDHYSDSICFLGFLYTLEALIAFFIFLERSLHSAGPSFSLWQALSLIGVSLSTSAAGMVFRNMLRSRRSWETNLFRTDGPPGLPGVR